MNKLTAFLPVGALAIMLAGTAAFGATSAEMKALDPDNDGSIDLAEAQAGAKKVFAAINPDGDDTLEADELKGRLSEKGLKAADPDNDGSLDMNEYMTLVEERFNAANPDGDTTIEQDELETKAGKKLLKLIYIE